MFKNRKFLGALTNFSVIILVEDAVRDVHRVRDARTVRYSPVYASLCMYVDV